MRKSFLIILVIALALFAGIAFLMSRFFIVSNEQTESTVASNVDANQIVANRQNPIWSNKIEKDSKLQTQADSLLNLFDKMSQVPVFIKDEPILKVGTNTERGLGYTICEPNNKPTIFIKKVFYQKNNQKQIINILKHELTHAYFCRQGVQVDHDSRWRKKFESVGGFGN
jgi:SprT-like family